jgi:polyphosphate kinase 2 (PPK2 family)
MEQIDQFYKEAVQLEEIWQSAGIRIIKFWFSVNKKEQARRFKQRETHPLRQGKLSEIDILSQDKWKEYTDAKERMFKETEGWVQVKSNCKRSARLAAMQYVLLQNEYEGKDINNIGSIDPNILKEL